MDLVNEMLTAPFFILIIHLYLEAVVRLVKSRVQPRVVEEPVGPVEKGVLQQLWFDRKVLEHGVDTRSRENSSRPHPCVIISTTPGIERSSTLTKQTSTSRSIRRHGGNDSMQAVAAAFSSSRNKYPSSASRHSELCGLTSW